MSKWDELQERLKGLTLQPVRLRADGHEVSLRKVVYREALVVEVYVDGWMKGEWHSADEHGKPAHPEGRFWRPMRSRAYPLKQHKVLKKCFGKQYADRATTLKTIGFLPYWNTPRSLVRHLRKHFPGLELIEESGGSDDSQD